MTSNNWYYKIPIEIRLIIIGIIIFTGWSYLSPKPQSSKLQDQIQELNNQIEINSKWIYEVDSILKTSEDLSISVKDQNSEIQSSIKQTQKKRNDILKKDINNIGSYSDRERDALWAKISTSPNYTLTPKE